MEDSKLSRGMQIHKLYTQESLHPKVELAEVFTPVRHLKNSDSPLEDGLIWTPRWLIAVVKLDFQHSQQTLFQPLCWSGAISYRREVKSGAPSRRIQN
ncbi:hypothetical protein AV530_006494 [Patagioenas fasciata monilis]|uniref:Uncharacterized protein n=1 Tax=Patagioenas fasciata monilis TaxID=372326 RepID=A0A1V4KGW4_PATFA|nr:hypothetical protein AV530_006494 [Patagioenas fasciata monilis]